MEAWLTRTTHADTCAVPHLRRHLAEARGTPRRLGVRRLTTNEIDWEIREPFDYAALEVRHDLGHGLVLQIVNWRRRHSRR